MTESVVNGLLIGAVLGVMSGAATVFAIRCIASCAEFNLDEEDEE